jgi:glutamate/tyrosine decarboxylase-like PLP-dependent enzyme
MNSTAASNQMPEWPLIEKELLALRNSGSGKTLPQEGVAWESLAGQLKQFKVGDVDWRRGRLPSFTYFYNDDILQKQIAAYSEFIVENGLGAGLAFKSITRMLKDIYDMSYDLFHAPRSAGASFTTGGTESLFQAVKTARDQARSVRGERYGIYNIVAATTSHATLNKIAQYLDVEVRRTPVDHEFRATTGALESAIDANTIMLFASAPCYPYGVFDRIEEIGELALRRNLWLHVDACWGGFISPFAEELGYRIPPWDFRVPGVTSLSADLHKFGYAVKGASLVIYRDGRVQQHEHFVFSDWPRGTYYTPTFCGSKPAGAVSSAWALMHYLGRSGYRRATQDTMTATTQLIEGIDAIQGLRCLKPHGESNLFAFESTDPALNIMAVADRLDAHGWMRGRLREPLAIHQGVVPSHLQVVAEYLDEVRLTVAEVRTKGLTGSYNERTY